MTYPLVQFVDAPAVDAVVRFDFNAAGVWADDRTWPRHEGFSIGVPAFEGDPGGVRASFGYRTLVFNQVITGSDMAAARVISALSRELLRETNWLLFQKSADSDPVWFKTYFSQPGELDFTQVRNDREGNSRWGLGVSLAADPFAYGAEETAGPFTVTNDPTAASYPMSLLMADIKGDAPAPALVKVSWSDDRTGYRHLLHSAPVVDGYAPVVWPIGTSDGWTLGADTAAGVADAAYVAGSYRPVSFATDATLVTRLSGAAPSAVAPGKYKVLVRVARSDTSSTFALRLGTKVVFSHIYGDTVHVTWSTSAAAGMASWVDLGEFTYPAGMSELDDTEADVTPTIALQAQRLSGTGSLRLDSFLLLPVGDDDARTLFVDNNQVGPSGSFLVAEYHDGDGERIYQRSNTTGALWAMYYPRVKGGFPLLTPGRSTVLHLVSQTTTTRGAGLAGDVPDEIASTANVTISYHPRWLYLGAG